MSRRFNGIPRGLRTAPSIVPKVHDKEAGKIRWTIGRIEGTNYALTKCGSIVNVHPRALTKKERRREKTFLSKKPGGHNLLCAQCKAYIYHHPSSAKVKPFGYEKSVRVETYECSGCGNHLDRDQVDRYKEALKKQQEDEARKASGQPPIQSTREWSPQTNPHPGRPKGKGGNSGNTALKRIVSALRIPFGARKVSGDDGRSDI